MDLNLKSVKTVKYDSIDDLLCYFFNCIPEQFDELSLIQNEIKSQLRITFQEFKHDILIQKNFGFVDNNIFFYWKSNDCSDEDFLCTIMRQLIEINKENFDENEEVKNEQLTLLARESLLLIRNKISCSVN